MRHHPNHEEEVVSPRLLTLWIEPILDDVNEDLDVALRVADLEVFFVLLRNESRALGPGFFLWCFYLRATLEDVLQGVALFAPANDFGTLSRMGCTDPANSSGWLALCMLWSVLTSAE